MYHIIGSTTVPGELLMQIAWTKNEWKLSVIICIVHKELYSIKTFLESTDCVHPPSIYYQI